MQMSVEQTAMLGWHHPAPAVNTALPIISAQTRVCLLSICPALTTPDPSLAADCQELGT